MAFLFDKVHKAVHELGNDLKDKFSDHGEAQSAGANEQHDQTGYDEHRETHRFESFAPHRIGNEAKWYVDGAGYMHAVSMAIERARESIWIMDWWLSPELYLRRPPAQNEQYRVDRMLQAAAERGVQVSAASFFSRLPFLPPSLCAKAAVEMHSGSNQQDGIHRKVTSSWLSLVPFCGLETIVSFYSETGALDLRGMRVEVTDFSTQNPVPSQSSLSPYTKLVCINR
jgi:hypothetical protein